MFHQLHICLFIVGLGLISSVPGQIIGFPPVLTRNVEVAIIGNSYAALYLMERLKQENKTFVFYQTPWSKVEDELDQSIPEPYPVYFDNKTERFIEVGPVHDTGQSMGFRWNWVTRRLLSDIMVEVLTKNWLTQALFDWPVRSSVLDYIKGNKEVNQTWNQTSSEERLRRGDYDGLLVVADFRTGEQLNITITTRTPSNFPDEWSYVKAQFDQILDEGLTWGAVARDQDEVIQFSAGDWLSHWELWMPNIQDMATMCDGMSNVGKQSIVFSIQHCMTPTAVSKLFVPLNNGLPLPDKIATDGYFLSPVHKNSLNEKRQSIRRTYFRNEMQFTAPRVKLFSDRIQINNTFLQRRMYQAVVNAKRMVITEQPTPRLLKYLFEGSPSVLEHDGNKKAREDFKIFRRLKATWLYGEIVEDNYLNPMDTFYNMEKGSNGPPSNPGMYTINRAELRNLRVARYTGEYDLDNEQGHDYLQQGRSNISATFVRIASKTERFLQKKDKEDFVFNFANKSSLIAPYMLTYSREDARDNLTLKFEALQGKHRIYWASPFFLGHQVARQWNSIEKRILPELLKD